MKIGEAKPTYYSNRQTLVDRIRDLASKKEKAENAFKATGNTAFSEQAATLELSLDATQKAFEENQKVLDSLIEQEVALANMESTKQQADAAAEEGENLAKIMTVFRRMVRGDIVPLTDEKKLMEFDDKIYQMAKNMQAMAQQLDKDHEKHKSLWEDEEPKEYPDPEEVANNTEFSGELPDIEIPETPELSDIEI